MSNFIRASQISERIKKAGIEGVGVEVTDDGIKLTGDPEKVALVQARIDRGEVDIRRKEAKTAQEIKAELEARFNASQLLNQIILLTIRREMVDPDSPLWAYIDRFKNT